MIPKQLKDMAFCRVRFKDKRPFENHWQIAFHDYDSIKKYFPKENYGILTGVNGLGVLDDDSEDKILIKLFEDSFGDTFKVRSHEYVILNGWDGKKIIFYDKSGKHLGELQGLGQQVVGPLSTHPSGEIYELKKDLPIKEIEFSEFKEVFSEYIKKEVAPTNTINKNQSFDGEDINNLSISSIFSTSGLNDRKGGNFQGTHPIHGSEGGMNFQINTNENVWCCYRCGTGGGIWTAIAVSEGIVDCSDCVHGFTLSDEQKKKVINAAIEKYGLRKKEQNTSQLEPMGWAKSINIKKMAERNNLLNCPKCNVPFEFNERLGWYKCKICGSKGGIKKFMEYIK